MRVRSSWAQLTGTSTIAVAALEGDEEDLRVEAPALDGLELEDGLRGGAGEGLEAALRIGKVQPHDDAGDGVEAAAEELAVERLAMGLAAAFKPARADGDVRARGDGGKEPLGLLDGRRQVGVGEHDHFAERLQHAGAHAVALAAVAGIFDQADLGGVGGKVAHHLGRGVAWSRR